MNVETRRLTDRQFCQVIASLQYDRDRLRAAGYTGDDCQSALDALFQGIRPDTNGLTYVLGQHEKLHTGDLA